MVYLQLFWSFLKIGFTSFGGMSMIPLISAEVIDHGWMTASQVTDILAIAEMTPGPLGLNCATFAGMQAAGVAGAIVANLGVMSPALTLTLVAGIFFQRFKDTPIMRRLLLGIRPACLGMILGMVITMTASNYFPNGGISPVALGIGAADLVLLLKYKWSIPRTILVSAAAGLLLQGVLGISIA